MADQWDPAKYVVEELGRIYVRADGRVEGGQYPPDTYKYPPDDELFGGDWEEGLQAIEDFDWGDGAQSTSEDLALPGEAGPQEAEGYDYDWVQKAFDIDDKAEATTCHKLPAKSKLQSVKSRASPFGTDKSAASSPSTALETTSQLSHDESGDVEMKEAPSEDDLHGAPVPHSEAPVAKPSPVSSSPWIKGMDQGTEDAVDTIMEEGVVDTRAPSRDPPEVCSPKVTDSTIQRY